nr:hypothetical protein [uncultured Methanomethylovorans sp.]
MKTKKLLNIKENGNGSNPGERILDKEAPNVKKGTIKPTITIVICLRKAGEEPNHMLDRMAMLRKIQIIA